MAASVNTSKARSLYRRMLRELPFRQADQTVLLNPSPLQKHIRSQFATGSPEKSMEAQMHEADQYVRYAKAQRLYLTLIERYNPGANMNEEERVRLTARRVGMDTDLLPGMGKKA